MNIIIPIGGIGQRFRNEGFLMPKPLISVKGKPMIFRVIENLNLEKDDVISIIYNPELKNYSFESLIRKEFPLLNINFLQLNDNTRGAAETVVFGLENLTELDLNKEIIVLDCDTIYHEDIIGKYKTEKNKNSIFFFNDTENKPIFSYIKTNNDGRVVEIAEKIKISDNANTGAYGFISGHEFKKYFSMVSERSDELYISLLYSEMIKDNVNIKGLEVNKFNCVGTPLQLKIYCENSEKLKPIRICFDLDNTLVTFPVVPGDYSTVEPIVKNIEYLRFLKNEGNYIIIHTARRMKTFNGNVGKIIPDISKVTLETIEKFNIPYDEIRFGKPWADFYVDDLAVSAFSPLEKSIGFYNTVSKPRSFNKIAYSKGDVKKETNNMGEVFWYNNIPGSIKVHFPEIYSINDNVISMERIKGVNYSHLYVNEALRERDLHDLIDLLILIHNSSDTAPSETNIYLSYSDKLKKRYEENLQIYNNIKNSNSFYLDILEKLSVYENNKSGKIGIIHGDPVFTNVFLTESRIKLIDPRGKIGDSLSIYGDVYYDFSKIFQSILGYDYILNGIEINYEYRDRMIDAFSSRFNEDELYNIKVITASLIFSLIPLHEASKEKFEKYFNIIEKLIR